MILNKTIVPGEGEISIKTYLCTSFSSFIFGIKAQGYLEITNKRLLFQALGKSITGNISVIHNEVPIAETVGINIYKGKAFHPFRLLLGMVLSQLVAAVGGIIIAFLFSFLSNSVFAYQFLIWALFFGAMYLAYLHNREKMPDDLADNADENSNKQLLIASLGLAALLSLTKGAFDPFHSYGSIVIAYPVYVAAFLYILYRFAKKPAFSLQIFTKSSSSAIVNVAGFSPLSSTKIAAKALSARPGKDSLLVLKEVGAIILDIQNMGDSVLDKWKTN